MKIIRENVKKIFKTEKKEKESWDEKKSPKKMTIVQQELHNKFCDDYFLFNNQFFFIYKL